MTLEWLADKCRLEKIADRSLCIRSYGGEIRSIPAYCPFPVAVAGVRLTVVAFVCPGTSTSYKLLLSLSWLNSVEAMGDYGKDEYWIKDGK